MNQIFEGILEYSSSVNLILLFCVLYALRKNYMLLLRHQDEIEEIEHKIKDIDGRLTTLENHRCTH